MLHFSPLVWLCALSAAALNTYTALDPTGVYSDYLDSLEADTPAISAFFSAAQRGVYPWSVLPDESEAPVTPPEEPPVIPDEPDTPSEPVDPFSAVDESYFDDALFLGDSHTDGLHCYAPFPNATYYTRNGLILQQVFTKSYAEVNGEKLTLTQALEKQSFGKIYLMLGINEVNYQPAEKFLEEYRAMLATLREQQPDALIFIQSVLHTTQEKSESSEFTNERINAYNAALQTLADGKTVFYLDINPVFDDETGALRADWSGDGIHVRAPYYGGWRDLLKELGVVKAAE